MLYLWWRMDEEGRRRVWSLYGRFCGLMVCGSCFGAVTWAARMMQLENGFNAQDAFTRRDFVQEMSLGALSFSWGAVYLVTYAIEFLCLSAAKLMVLDRMSVYAAGQDEGSRKRWTAAARAVMAVVVLGNAVGLAANIAAAVHVQRAAEASSTASALFAANSTQLARESSSLANTEVQLASSIAAVQSLCEVVVLLLIVAAFIAAGLACARRIILYTRQVAYNQDLDAAVAVLDGGKQQRLQHLGTTAFVFVAFVLRSVQSTMFAVARQLQDVADGQRRCPGVTDPCDPSCFNEFTLIQRWWARTPEFQVTVVLVSSPVALLVALWGVTSRYTLQLMKLKQQGMAVQQDLIVVESRR
jgi:hypothetical protein